MANSADALFRVKVDAKLFVLDRITLGDWRMFNTEFGLKTSDVFATIPDGKGGSFEILNINNPSVLVALLTAALHHEAPERPISLVVSEVEAFELGDLEFPDLKTVADENQENAEADPTKDGDEGNEATAAPPRTGSGKSAKPPKKPGRPS